MNFYKLCLFALSTLVIMMSIPRGRNVENVK